MKLIIKTLCTISLALLLVLPGCKEDDLPGYSQAINPIWEYDYNLGDLSGSMAPLLYGNKVLYSPDIEITADYDSNEKLIALDGISGKLIWEWSDFFFDKYASIGTHSVKYFYDNILVFVIGSRSFAINVNDGTTLWRKQTVTGESHVIGNKNMLYNTDSYEPFDIGVYCDQLMEADIHTGDWKTIFEVKGGDSLRQGLTVPAFHTNDNGDEVFIMGNTTVNRLPGDTKHFATPYLIAYNRTQERVEYNVQLFKSGLTNRVDWYPKLLGDKVYVTLSTGIACHDANTGERLWMVKTEGDFLFSGMLIADGRIYATQSGIPTLYCIDPDNGNILWQQPSAGSASPIQYHKGVLYFTSGHSGALHIVNATTGETIHKILAPSEFENSNDFFNAAGCVIDTEEDRIYLSSFTKAYCYPTVEL